ncbi:ATP-binding protein [Granulicella sp. L60]|uniref:ATP-binding protein n=1 Tax=Granulicella sp. L60 TaxID=1641866 RepID=UPI00131BF3AC|nr:ATP-binding protein [Granulicella sp. L60]
MKFIRPANIRTRIAIWFVAILASILVVYIAAVFVFQYVLLERQIFHDEIQDVETVEGLLYFDSHDVLHLQESYHSHPQSRLLEDRLMEVRDLSGKILYRSETLKGELLGGTSSADEGVHSYNERSTKLSDGTRVLLISHLHPVQDRVVLIRLGYSIAPLQDRMLHFFLLLLLATPIGLIMAGFAGYRIARKALLPLDLMAARAELITANNLNDRIIVEHPHDELGHMAKVLNHLLERLEQAFVQLQRFTADAAHELRTPLASLRTTGEVTLQEGRTESGYREAIGSMLEETTRLNQTIDGLLLLARAETTRSGGEDTLFSLIELVDEILVLLDVLLEERHITVLQEHDDGGSNMLFADRSLIRVALLNVLHNAVKFSPDRSALRIVISRYQLAGRVFQRVCVHDGGPGISAGEVTRVFERFFTSNSPGTSKYSGSGLGLSIAKLIVDRSGGQIFFDTTVEHGAKCCVDLPVRE